MTVVLRNDNDKGEFAETESSVNEMLPLVASRYGSGRQCHVPRRGFTLT